MKRIKKKKHSSLKNIFFKFGNLKNDREKIVEKRNVETQKRCPRTGFSH